MPRKEPQFSNYLRNSGPHIKHFVKTNTHQNIPINEVQWSEFTEKLELFLRDFSIDRSFDLFFFQKRAIARRSTIRSCFREYGQHWLDDDYLNRWRDWPWSLSYYGCASTRRLRCNWVRTRVRSTRASTSWLASPSSSPSSASSDAAAPSAKASASSAR